MEITNRKFFQEAQQLKTRPSSGRYGRTRAQERILFFFYADEIYQGQTEAPSGDLAGEEFSRLLGPHPNCLGLLAVEGTGGHLVQSFHLWTIQSFFNVPGTRGFFKMAEARAHVSTIRVKPTEKDKKMRKQKGIQYTTQKQIILRQETRTTVPSTGQYYECTQAVGMAVSV